MSIPPMPIAKGQPCPWGRIETVTKVADGIVSVTTSSHGGLWLSPARQLTLPPTLASFTPWTGTQEWWEEDADWAVVVLAWPNYWPEDVVRTAVEITRPRPGARYFAAIVAFFAEPAGLELRKRFL